MVKVFNVFLFVISAFVIESVAGDLLGPWVKPNLLIILIVFFDLFRGIRYALLVAVMAGLLKDSFTVGMFGVNTFSFVISAYLATTFKMYIYHVGSVTAKFLLVFLVVLSNIFLQYLLQTIVDPIPFEEMFTYVLLPEVLTTTVIAQYVLEKYKKCAKRLFA